jgi:hypothetical protein
MGRFPLPCFITGGYLKFLIGGFNPPENISKIGSSSELLGKMKKCSKPPTRFNQSSDIFGPRCWKDKKAPEYDNHVNYLWKGKHCTISLCQGTSFIAFMVPYAKQHMHTIPVGNGNVSQQKRWSLSQNSVMHHCSTFCLICDSILAGNRNAMFPHN